MNPAERFHATLDGRLPDRPAVVPKIWIDLAATLERVPFVEAIRDPRLAMHTVVRAARSVGADAARLFTFPARRVDLRQGRAWQLDANGQPAGEIDLEGGWATHFRDPAAVDPADPATMAHYALLQRATPLLDDPASLDRLAIPASSWYDDQGYGAMVDEIAAEVGTSIGLIGDCSSGTLAFYVGLRGMDRALLDLYDAPDLVEATMARGIDLCVERAAFFLRHGIRVLRYNDSVANMSVISPPQWRRFVFPHLQSFCRRVHALSASARIYCHICGDVRPILCDLAATGLDCLAPLDPLGGMRVGEVRRVLGPEAILMGGVDTQSFVRAAPRELRAAAAACLEAGWSAGRYVLGSGCVVPRIAPRANLEALAEAAVAFGSR